MEQGVRLTLLAASGGCAAKLGADLLEGLVAGVAGRFRPEDHPELLVGLAAPDDAAVYRLDDQRAIIQTVDFFPPVVDDPYTYGAVAAANAMNDVYAMGGEVLLALNVAALPDSLPSEVIAAIFRGAADKVAEAGGVVAGGHTIRDEVPKFGLCVMGLVHPQRIFTTAGARPGDVVLLTKPLGTGLILSAAKGAPQEPAGLASAVDWMLRLNRRPAQVLGEVNPHAVTDVTGFGLLGHAYAIARNSGVRLRISASRLPLLPGAIEIARDGLRTAADGSNRRYVAKALTLTATLDPALEALLYDPQTSGGLLVCLPEEEARRVEDRFGAEELSVWRIGGVEEGAGVTVEP